MPIQNKFYSHENNILVNVCPPSQNSGLQLLCEKDLKFDYPEITLRDEINSDMTYLYYQSDLNILLRLLVISYI